MQFDINKTFFIFIFLFFSFPMHLFSIVLGVKKERWGFLQFGIYYSNTIANIYWMLPFLKNLNCLSILLYNIVWFCHTLTWICHGCTCVPHPEPPSHLPPHPVPLGHPSAPAPSILYHASNLDWWFVSHMIIYMFQCHSPISSCPRPLPQSPKDCSTHLCLSCCLEYRVIITIFLYSIYMR